MEFFEFGYRAIGSIFTYFLIFCVAIIVSCYLREGVKRSLDRYFTRNLVTKEKRSRSKFYFMNFIGFFLFLIVGVGFSGTAAINYSKYHFSRRLIIILAGLFMNILLVIASFYVYHSDFFWNQFEIFRIFLLLLFYTNLMLVFVNIFPFPFSDMLFILLGFDDSVFNFLLVQSCFVVAFFAFNLNKFFYVYSVDFLSKIFNF